MLGFRELLQTLQEHTGRVNSAAFSADGKRIVSGSDDRTVKLFASDSRGSPSFLMAWSSGSMPLNLIDARCSGVEGMSALDRLLFSQKGALGIDA